MKKVLFMIFTILLVSSSLIMAEVEGDLSKSFKVKKGGLLTITADIGSIKVEAAGSSKVDVKVEFEQRKGTDANYKSILKKIDVDFKSSGKNVEVNLDYKNGLKDIWKNVGKYVRVKFYVTVPKVYNVNLQTSGGGIKVDDLEGEVKAKTSGGSLDFGNINGEVYGKTSGGGITVDGCTKNVDIRTSGGGITLGHVKGIVKAHTSGGSIRVKEVMNTINAHTSGGGIKVYISKQPAGDCSLTTSGGSITAYLADGLKLDVNAKTSGGHINTDFPITMTGNLSKKHLKTALNGGGKDLVLKTSGGSIYLKKQ